MRLKKSCRLILIVEAEFEILTHDVILSLESLTSTSPKSSPGPIDMISASIVLPAGRTKYSVYYEACSLVFELGTKTFLVSRNSPDTDMYTRSDGYPSRYMTYFLLYVSSLK